MQAERSGVQTPDLSRLSLATPTDLPLEKFNPRFKWRTTHARRLYVEHTNQMAVLAYHLNWDSFVNRQLNGERDYLRPFDRNDWFKNAMRYVAMYAFFAPLDELNRLLKPELDAYDGPTLYEVPSSLNEYNVGIGVRAEPPTDPYQELDLKNAACDPQLVLLGKYGANQYHTDAVAQMIATIIEKGGQDRDSNEAYLWYDTVDEITRTLKNQARPISGLYPSIATLYSRIFPVVRTHTVLWRGMTLPTDFFETPVRPVVWRMNTSFVSTTKDRLKTETFLPTPAEEERLNNQFSRWQLCMIISPEVPIIDVERELPEGWRCHKEGEVMIAPGAHYRIKSVKRLLDSEVGKRDEDTPFAYNDPVPETQPWEVNVLRATVFVSMNELTSADNRSEDIALINLPRP